MPSLVTIYAHLAQVASICREPAFPLANALPLWGVRGYAISKKGRLALRGRIVAGAGVSEMVRCPEFRYAQRPRVYNGMNILVSMCGRLNAIRDGKADSVNDYFATLPTAVSVRVWNAPFRIFVRVLNSWQTPARRSCGLEIDFSAKRVLAIPALPREIEADRTLLNWLFRTVVFSPVTAVLA